MHDEIHRIADTLIQEYGVEGAIKLAVEATAVAIRNGDNYDLSVWREVKVVLNGRKNAKK